MLYHQTKDPHSVKDFLGHKSMKNTEKYVNIERQMFADYGADELSIGEVTQRAGEVRKPGRYARRHGDGVGYLFQWRGSSQP